VELYSSFIREREGLGALLLRKILLDDALHEIGDGATFALCLGFQLPNQDRLNGHRDRHARQLGDIDQV